MSRQYRVRFMPTVSNPNLEFVFPVSMHSEAEIVGEALSMFHIFLDDNELTEIDANVCIIEMSEDDGETWKDLENF